jgi:hypothetical protein
MAMAANRVDWQIKKDKVVIAKVVIALKYAVRESSNKAQLIYTHL